MGIAKVTTNYQVTIPKDIRRIHGIKIGDTDIFIDFFRGLPQALPYLNAHADEITFIRDFQEISGLQLEKPY